MGCDNINLDLTKISDYYRHPIWLLNGFFIEQHDLSLQHRYAISDWIVKTRLQRVLDFGGGFGTLARMIADKSPETIVNIFEPYPSDIALSQCRNHTNVSFVNNLTFGYDCLVSTDVLEHVGDPLELFSKMIEVVNLNGYLVIANHFFPSIKCHLPITFHFRYSFDEFAEVMGLKKVALCEGSHATIYQKIKDHPLDWEKIRRMEKNSQRIFIWKEFHNKYLSPSQSRLKRLWNNPADTLKRAWQKFSKAN
jgi:2-polyprenyl-3-methyl-5-hydroxy-6-metoxy-1,4-benzoquinol methylase